MSMGVTWYPLCCWDITRIGYSVVSVLTLRGNKGYASIVDIMQATLLVDLTSEKQLDSPQNRLVLHFKAVGNN